ncbi:MAG: nucleotidyl transferase AbiEii/AbiGii toxin family protein [Anaerolineales bacterium]|nr:nucleotidyl transferase AbiEii/AbiGii toxin family protein [Anaerolineales bacterium]
MKEPVKNIPASILTRLRNQAIERNRPFAETLQYYAMERFLYRLSKTNYADKFILKGGLLFYVWNLSLRRSTRDIDFRGYISRDRSTLLKIIHQVIEVSAPEDGLVFDPQSVSVEETQIDADYRGIRIKLVALLERTHIPVQIDIGFSDELILKPETIEYPNMLPDQKIVRMKGYPKETVVAEKFHAMIRHGDLNSRMKDYYDLWLISETFEFDDTFLQKAIQATFKKRETDIPTERPSSLSADFARANQTRWRNFLKKLELDNIQVNDFQTVLQKIWKFLEQPVQSSPNRAQSTLKWTPRSGWE